jgi:hypothetical protein
MTRDLVAFGWAIVAVLAMLLLALVRAHGTGGHASAGTAHAI